MEFGSFAKIDGGANVIGVSWTSKGPTEEANHLITTTESRVAVYAAEDRSLRLSWITRPGSYNKFSVAAVQNRILRKFLCVQDGNRLFSWHEDDASLETAAKRKLPGTVYALRTSKRLRLNCVVYTDGAVSFIDDALADVVSAAGQDDGTIATWARLTKTPGDDSKFFLLVLKQKPVQAIVPITTEEPTSVKAKTPGKREKKQPPTSNGVESGTAPYLLVYVLSVKASEHGESAYNLKAAARHVFEAPAPDAGRPFAQVARIGSISLHKIARAMCLIWTNGVMQVLNFPVTSGFWYAQHPKESIRRQLARFHPDEGVEEPAELSPCAAFALEPSCVVLAGSSSSDASIGLSVWDVRYGVVLALQRLSETAGAAASEAGERRHSVSVPSAPATRKRSESAASATSQTQVGSLLQSQQAVSLTPVTPETVFQVLVSEDNAYVAVASRRQILLVDVAARGASLVSAIDRMAQTRAFLSKREQQYVVSSTATCSEDLRAFMPSVTRYAAPVVPLSDCLRSLSAKDSAARQGIITLIASDSASSTLLSHWQHQVAAAGEECVSDCSAILDSSATPTTESVVSVIRKYTARTQWWNGCGDARAASTEGAGPKSSKRPRQTDHISAASSGAAAGTEKLARVTATVPSAIVSAAASRCTAEIRRFLSRTLDTDPVTSVSIIPIIRELLCASALTASQLQDLLPALVDAAAAPSRYFHAAVGGGKATLSKADTKKRGRAPAPQKASDLPGVGKPQEILSLLRDIITSTSDVSENLLVHLFVAALHRVPGVRLQELWVSALAASERPSLIEPPAGGWPPAMGLIYWTSILVGAPRNDVFLEHSLSKLAVDDAAALLASLLRLAELHAAEGGQKRGHFVVTGACSYGQVLDWIRMTFDSHFTRFIHAAKMDATPAGTTSLLKGSTHLRGILEDFVRLVRTETNVGELSSVIRAHVLHLLGGGPLPLPPPPDHLVELLPM